MDNDTICAISTALGVGAISIIRISGKDSVKIVNNIFSGTDLTKVPTHTIHYGFIKDKEKYIDEVLISVMLAPKTFTRENIVEINCHGGISTTNKVLEILLNSNCRLAEPGEFTKRAFLNGRIDLLEAESIGDLINAETESARKMALSGVQGNISKLIINCRKNILDILANIAVNIDYPEYEDALEITNNILNEKLTQIKYELENLLNESENGRIAKDGITIALVGRPNVGKSSILNTLLNQEKAIVTDIAGTTRDIVEGEISLCGVKLKLIDTAGIRNTNDEVEKIGVNKSLETIEKAELVILILNSNEKLTEEDKKLIDQTKNKKRIIFLNKTDLPKNIKLNLDNVIEGNTKELEGLTSLKNKIKELFSLEQLNSKDFTYLSNARQISLVRKSLDLVKDILKNAQNVPVDILEIDIKRVYDLLGEIIGSTYKDELLDELFSKYCLGK